MMNRENDRRSQQREACFQSDEIMDSMLAKWYQSEQDGEEFWDAIEQRLKQREVATQHTEAANYLGVRNHATSANQSLRQFGLDRFQIGLLAASLMVGGFVMLLIVRLAPPADNITAAGHTSQNESATEQSTEFTIEATLRKPTGLNFDLVSDQESDQRENLLPADEIELFDQDTPTAPMADTTGFALDHNDLVEPRQGSNEKQLATDLDRKLKTKFLAARISDAGMTDDIEKPHNRTDARHQLDSIDEKSALSQNYLRIAVELNRSGYGRIAINGRILVKKLLPVEAAILLKQIEPFFGERMRVFAPRIGFVGGNIFLGTEKSGERIEFQSAEEFQDAIATAANELPNFKTNYRRRASIHIQADKILKMAVQRADNIFQEWAKEAIENGTPITYGNDPTQRFVAIISERDFRKYAKSGNFDDVGIGQFDASTTMQKLKPNDLRTRLEAEATEVGLYGSADEFLQFQTSVLAMQSRDNRPRNEVIEALLSARPDLNGLPLVMGDECHLSPERSQTLQQISRSIGPVLARFDGFSSRRSSNDPNVLRHRNLLLLRQISMVDRHFRNHQGDSHQKLLTVDQMLQIEEPELRLELVKLLGQSESQVSANLLACYVKYDLDPKVRMSATNILRSFPSKWVRPKLLEGLRYPWPEAAKHAAEGLIRLNDMKAIPELVELLKRPDPRRPRKIAPNMYVRKELVAINHLKNCLLCHADSTSNSDHGRAPVPQWERPLPPAYYNAQTTGLTARADVTYLRQDFSVVHEVKDHGSWPANQRFDYVVRKTTMNEAEAEQITEHFNDSTNEYRDAVIFALQMLTDQKPSDNSYHSWKEITTKMGFVL